MATTFIVINTGQRLGSQLRNALDQFRQSKDLLIKLQAIMLTQIDVSDYAVLEQQFGLQAGQGPIVSQLVAGVISLLGSNEKVDSLLNQLG